MTLALVLLGGAIGAPLRYLTDLLVQARHDSVLPWGTFAVNIVGSVILGGIAAAAVSTDLPTWVLPLVATGFCGALTTFSTFSYESFRLLEEGSTLAAAANSLGSLVVGLAACAAAYAGTTAVL
jgi:fluoride exporter